MAKKATKRRAWTGVSPNAKDDGSEEGARWTYRQDAEANRGCTRQKAFSMGLSLDSRAETGGQPASRCLEAPPYAGLFILKGKSI